MTTNEMTPADLAVCCGNNGNDGFGGGNGWWVLLLFLLAGNGGWGFGGGFGGGYGNMMLGYDFPWLLNGQQQISNNTNNGFRDAMINDGITSIRDGISGLSTQLCGCCGDMQMALANGFAGVERGANARQIANMQADFALQNAINFGFNGTQTGLADLKYTVATENCADRNVSAQNTQAILTALNAGVQSIKDQLCQDKIDAKNDEIAQLRQEVLFARGQASQDVQTATIRAGQATTANQLVNELRSCPIPAMPVYGQTPIFTCGGNGGCGCGNGFMN